MTEYFTLAQARKAASAADAIAEAIGIPYEQWARRCHEISLRILRTGWFGPGRMARGWAEGTRGQHSWIVLGRDVYAPAAVCVDPTIRHYRGTPELGIWVDKFENMAGRWQPHGYGSIWQAGRPAEPAGPVIGLTPSAELSPAAREFLELLGPLDRRGWMQLASLPMGGWPSAEIIAAMNDTEELKAVIPIDILGMLTDVNPGKLYF